MTYKERFKEEIFEIACKGDIVAVDKETNKPCCCTETHCCNCALKCEDMSYSDTLAEWLEAEYVEPCPFEKDELVEVSNGGTDWCLRHFSHINNEDYFGKFFTFNGGLSSKETSTATNWKYCRKYGTLGGLVKGETE